MPPALLRRRDRLRANVTANYLGKLWAVASIYLFVPLYVHLLGAVAYGLIAFHAVALSILVIADAGLSATFSRQAAREREPQRLMDQLVSIEVVLYPVLFVGAASLVVFAPQVASGWLRVGDALSQETVVNSLRLMALALVPQVAWSLYLGGLMGRQLQVAANGWHVAFTTARSAGVLLPLLWDPRPEVFFLWQAACGWCFLFALRRALRQEICALEQGAAIEGRPSWTTLNGLVAYAAGMFAMALIAGLNTQLDRLVVSKLRPMEEFAFYSLAATLAQVPTMIAVPIAAALLPRLTQLVESDDRAALLRLYETASYAIAALAAACAGFIGLHAEPLLRAWLPSSQPWPASLPQVTSLLSLGGMLLALQLMPFQLSLAHGHNLTNVKVGAFVLVAGIPLQVLLTDRFGLLGAAVPWALLGLLGFATLGYLLNRRFMSGRVSRWFIQSTLVPALFGAGPLWIACLFGWRWPEAPGVTLLVGLLAASGGLVLAYHFRPHARLARALGA